MSLIAKTINTINAVNTTIGKAESLLLLPLVFVVAYEVVLRYVFNAPTTWGFELTVFLYGVHYMLGMAFNEQQKGNVAVDFIVQRMSPKVRAWIGIFSYTVMFLPVWTLMSIWAVKYAVTSTMNQELNATSWAPPIWPLKIIMAVSVVLLLFQGVASLLEHVQALKEADKA